LFSRVFYEAARDLDSQPSPRTDHVEACRPRELLLMIARSQCEAIEPSTPENKRVPARWQHRLRRAYANATRENASDAAPATEEPSPSSLDLELSGFRWRGLAPLIASLFCGSVPRRRQRCSPHPGDGTTRRTCRPRVARKNRLTTAYPSLIRAATMDQWTILCPRSLPYPLRC